MKAVEAALSTRDLRKYLAEQLPSHLQYRALREALLRYRTIAAAGGWPTIDSGPTLRPGASDRRVGAVRRRLYITGDLSSERTISSQLYDSEVTAAVKRFQRRHGLREDGILGQATRTAMNIPVEDAIGRIIVNLERWRQQERNLGENHVLVNIAGFNLQGVKEGRVQIEMAVIVGKPHQQTPVFDDAIEYVEFNPYWNVPTTIAYREILPKLKKDSAYLKKHGFRLFDGWGPGAKEIDPDSVDWKHMGRRIRQYRIRQDPGPENAVGKVKFVFPNSCSVCMHDTPHRALFSRPRRAFSHGCIRVSQPPQLASYVLGGEVSGWGLEHVNGVIEAGQRRIVDLATPLPIHIVYQTVWVDKEGALHFNPDVYARGS